jgi:hypothetical protein
VPERESFGVQEVAPEIANVRPELRVLDSVVAPAAVRFVTDYWMFQPCEVNANLVRAAGMRLNGQQRDKAEIGQQPIVRD